MMDQGEITNLEHDGEPPVHHPTRLQLAFFTIVDRLTILWKFQSLRVLHEERVASVSEDVPLIVILNHPSWWDPVPILQLQLMMLPERVGYFPTESEALLRASHLSKLGSFPLHAGSVSGTKRFIKDCKYVLSFPDAVLFITPEGQFRDPRKRPLELRRGVASLIARLKTVTVIPLAVEYTLWEGTRLEILTSWGEPVRIEDGSAKLTSEWHAMLTQSLTAAMDELAEISIKREHWRFRTLVYGGLGRRNLGKLINDIKTVFRHRRPDRL